MFLFHPLYAEGAEGTGGAGGAPGSAPAGADPFTGLRDGLSDELKAEPTIQKLTDFPDMAKQLVTLQHKLGNNVAIPTDTSPPEVLTEFRKRIGVPEEAKGYTVPTENMPKIELDESLVSSFRTEAHRLGLPAKHFAGVARWLAKESSRIQTEAVDADKSRRDAAEAELRKAFGDDYDERIASARGALGKFADASYVNYLNDHGLANDPATIQTWAAVGKALGDDEILGGGGARPSGKTPTEAQTQISAKMLDEEFAKAYLDAAHPGHEAAITEMMKLHKAAYPGGGGVKLIQEGQTTVV